MKTMIPSPLRFGGILALLLLTTPTLRAEWQAVRDLIRAGDKLTDQARQEKIYRQAYATARASVAARPRDANEYLWLANAAGRLAQVAGVKERIELSKVVKDNAEKAIELDPKNGGAYMTLGAWHFYVTDLSWVQKNAAKVFYGGLPPASYEKAVEMLTKALTYGVENPVETHYIRGMAYEELGKDKEAMADYRRSVAGTPRTEKERTIQKEAKERLD